MHIPRRELELASPPRLQYAVLDSIRPGPEAGILEMLGISQVRHEDIRRPELLVTRQLRVPCGRTHGNVLLRRDGARGNEQCDSKDSGLDHRLKKIGSITVVTNRKPTKLSSAAGNGARHNLATTSAYTTRASRRVRLPSPQPTKMLLRKERATMNETSCTANATNALPRIADLIAGSGKNAAHSAAAAPITTAHTRAKVTAG